MNEATKQFYDKIENEQKFLFHHDNVTEGSGKYTRKKHYHNLFEIYYFTGGECNYFIDNKSYRLMPGDIVLIPEGVIHNSEYGSILNKSVAFGGKRRKIYVCICIARRNKSNSLFAKLALAVLRSEIRIYDIQIGNTNVLTFIRQEHCVIDGNIRFAASVMSRKKR